MKERGRKCKAVKQCMMLCCCCRSKYEGLKALSCSLWGLALCTVLCAMHNLLLSLSHRFVQSALRMICICCFVGVAVAVAVAVVVVVAAAFA